MPSIHGTCSTVTNDHIVHRSHPTKSQDSQHVPSRWPCGKASASAAEDLDSILAFAVDGFPVRVMSSDLKIDTTVATLLSAWRYKVCSRTGWLGVSIVTG